MSEEQIQDALGAAAEEEELQDDTQLEENEKQKEDDLSDLTPAEQRAWQDGWRPFDQFEGNPANWKTAEAYNLYGEMQGDVRAAKAETRRIKEEMDARIANLNKLHQAQQQALISDLKAKQRVAIEDGAVSEYDRLQTQIDAASAPEQVEQAPSKAPEILEWEQKNAWCQDPNDERTIQANAFYQIAAAKPGATYDSALQYVDEQLSKLYPEHRTPSNPRREMPSMTEQSKAPRPRSRGGRELTMADLTQSERDDWNKFGKLMFSDEKQYLKSVADARKA